MNKDLINAGDVDIQLLELSTVAGIAVDLRDYLVEINMFQDIFMATMHGNIMLSDSRNIIHDLYISGYEMLRVKVATPSLPDPIEKTFRVYSITDRQIVRDNNTQTYILHFCSLEAFVDNITPIHRFFEGKITDIVETIYTENLLVEESKGLTILDDTSNKMEYISPGWSPIKNINWLASRAMSNHSSSPTFLFWETPFGFFFGSIEHILKTYKDGNYHNGEYTYTVSSHWNNVEGNQKGRPILADMFRIIECELLEQTDEIAKINRGYYANSLYTFDINQKKLGFVQYDHPTSWNDYTHLEREGVAPLFVPGLTFRSPETVIKLESESWNLFKITNGTSDDYYKIWGRRRAILQEYSSNRINITIPGRTDLIAGNVVKINFVKAAPRSNEDAAKEFLDTVLSGYYLVSSLRHKITLTGHYIIAEVVKDSLSTIEGSTDNG